MSRPRFGISDIAFHIPAPAVRLATLVEHRGTEERMRERLHRALAYTGQEWMRIPDWYEDTVTMVSEATRHLLARNPRVPPGRVRHYACGTETAQDEAKPVASYAQGLVDVDGVRIGPGAATYEVKHACASGTYALFSVLNALAAEHLAGLPGAGVAAMGDIASYPTGTTAELTQGAGAAALLVEENPRLLALDLGVTGIWGESVDDFFRSVGNRHASVRGRFSVECYMRALAGAYEDYKQRALATKTLARPTGGHFLDAVDYAVLHAPFHSMPVRAMEDLLMRARGTDRETASRELERLRLKDGLGLIRHTGNLYTGSLYLCLAELLAAEYERLGTAIEGKRVLLASYGSGNTMVVFGGTVVPGAGEVIRRFGLREHIVGSGRPIGMEEYERLARLDRFSTGELEAAAQSGRQSIPAGAYYLETIREDGYRNYAANGRRQ